MNTNNSGLEAEAFAGTKADAPIKPAKASIANVSGHLAQTME